MAEAKGTRARKPPFANRLVIMAKSPRRGAVKQRLASEIGEGAALRFYRSCLGHSIARLASDRRWLTLLAITPDQESVPTILPARSCLQRLPQGRGDLGQRMQRFFQRLPSGPVIIVGSDIPAIAPDLIAEAFALLKQSDAVFGKARDGGYWLVGLKRSPRLLAPFARVRWSSPHALADTLLNLEGRRIAFATELGDVDTRADYRALRPSAERLVGPFSR
jgi:rSAM/selenodomain-associated transferase 1